MFHHSVTFVLLVINFVSFSKAGMPCEPSRKPYTVPHEEYCDKFYLCQPSSSRGTVIPEAIEMSCDDGLVFDPILDKCDFPHTVPCGPDRPKLQEPQNPTVNCPRLNGMFPVPGTCDQFSHCSDGLHTLITCAPGLSFQASVGACVHADQVLDRPDCSASRVLDFTCPNSFGQPLRFGDHDRLPHPTSCQHFYLCLLTGLPRLAGCGSGLVFNPSSGICDVPENVPGCEHLAESSSSQNSTAVEAVKVPHPKSRLVRKGVRLMAAAADGEDMD